jgi:hypothetical protein
MPAVTLAVRTTSSASLRIVSIARLFSPSVTAMKGMSAYSDHSRTASRPSERCFLVIGRMSVISRSEGSGKPSAASSPSPTKSFSRALTFSMSVSAEPAKARAMGWVLKSAPGVVCLPP